MKLKETDPKSLVSYIKSSIEILLNMKEEELDFLNKEKSEEIVKLKTKLKKISSNKRGTTSKAP
jgi:hypothetical protein